MRGSWALVAHTSNPSYSGGLWFKASPGKFVRPYLEKKKKKTFTKKGWWSGSNV
jgi:hypothetical protein